MKKILVTGHQGYIGTVLTDYLVEKGFEVSGVDNGFFEGSHFITRQHDIPWQKKDIRDLTVSDLKGFDAIIHLAALSNDPLGYLDKNLTYEINFQATIKLAKSAIKAGVKRFAYSSSCSMYGVSTKEYVTEEDALNPQTPYAESKILAETGLRKLANDDFCPIYLRNSTVFGLSPRMRLDLVVNNLVAHAMSSNEIKIMSDGTPWRPLVHVEDVCRAFEAVLLAERSIVWNESFNVGDNANNLQVREIAKQVKEVIPNMTVKIMNQVENDSRSYKVSFKKINSKLGWKAKYSVKDGIKQLHKYLKKIGFNQDVFNTPLYTTLEQIKLLQHQGKIDKTFRERQVK